MNGAFDVQCHESDGNSNKSSGQGSKEVFQSKMRIRRAHRSIPNVSSGPSHSYFHFLFFVWYRVIEDGRVLRSSVVGRKANEGFCRIQECFEERSWNCERPGIQFFVIGCQSWRNEGEGILSKTELIIFGYAYGRVRLYWCDYQSNLRFFLPLKSVVDIWGWMTANKSVIDVLHFCARLSPPPGMPAIVAPVLSTPLGPAKSYVRIKEICI